MATAAGDSTAYAGGAGGKFRRRPFRKAQTTPYDRPPTALRLTRRNHATSTTAAWLSRILHPASKLITASAHKLFSSVFRNRLLPPPHPSKDEEVEALEIHSGDAMTEAPSSTQERDTTEGITHNGSTADGVAGLANILKQKTFTKSEIDRLTALLQSREVVKTATEAPDGMTRYNEVRRPAFENRINPYDFSRADLTPTVRSNVNFDDVTSPTVVAKAYMGGMCTRVSPSTLGSRSQTLKETTPALTTLTSHRSNGSIMQKPLSPVVTSQKDFAVSRSRGRSAIYSMARTPHFNAQITLTKGLATTNDAFDGNSLLSSQKTLKRRSSVLENDIGSVGPIRRIRQKPNLLYQKTVDLPSCTPSTSATPSGVGEASSSRLHEEGGEKSPSSNSHVSSKSMEMGHRILQQLEKMTPPKDRYNKKKPGFSGGMSSMKLTPSMLSGQARKSLETIDLSKYVCGDEVRENKLDSGDTVHEAQDSTTKEQNKFYNSSKALMISSSNVYPENGDARGTYYDVIDVAKDTAATDIKSSIVVPQKSPAFHMSAYEDDLDMDDDAYVTPSVIEGKRNFDASYLQSNGKLPENPSSEASEVGRPAFLGVESSLDSGLKNATTAEASSNTVKRMSHDISDSVLNNTIGSLISSLQPVKTSADKADLAASNVSFDLKSYAKVSPPSLKQSSAADSSSATDVTSSSFAFGAASAHAPIKSPNNSIYVVGLFKKADNAPTSVLGSSISTIGSFAAPSPVMFSSPSPFGVTSLEVGPDVANSSTDTAPITSSSENMKVSVTFPSFQSTFGASSLTSDSATMAAPSTHTAERPKKADLVNSPSSNIFGTASVPAQSPPAYSFQFGASVTSGIKSQLEAPSNGSVFGDQTLFSPTASEPKTEPVTSQPTGSLPSASAFTTSFAFGSSSSGSSSMAAAFGSVSNAPTNIFGGISQQTSSPVFGSTLNNSSAGLNFGVSAPATPSSASSALSFGTSSMSAPANGSSTTVTFGSSSTSTGPAPTPSGDASSGFAFGTSSLPAPANGTSNGSSAGSFSLFGFGASSSALSIDSSSTFSFGASPAPPSSSSAPTSTFSFGASPAPPASSSAPSSSKFPFGASPAPPPSSSSPSSTFSLGASPSPPASSPASSSAPSSSTFSFGASPPPPASSSAPSSSTFSFGASPSPPASSSAPSSSSSARSSSTFSFGASLSPPASSSASSSTFSFGVSPSPPVLSSAPSSSAFSFGASSTPLASSSAPSSTFSFGASPASSTAPLSAFSFGASSAPASSTTPSTFLFGASSAPSTTNAAPVFPFGSAATSTALQPSQPAFGTTSVFGFGSTPSPSPMGSNDQMSMEDSMVEDPMHQSPTMATPTPVFGQSPTSNFSFGMSQPQPQAAAQAQLAANPFQFGGQQNLVAASLNPFQASGSFDGGSFSLGAGGNDKSNRRIVKVKSRNRKK